MKQKIVVICLVVILLLAGGVFFYFHKNSSDDNFYKDDLNKVGFEKPQNWSAYPTSGYVRVGENSADPTKPSILVKLDFPESIIPALGLDNGTEIKFDNKTMRRADNQSEIPAVGGRPASAVTFTHLLWQAPDGRKIIFEISPWQKPDFNPDIEKFLTSFNPSL